MLHSHACESKSKKLAINDAKLDTFSTLPMWDILGQGIHRDSCDFDISSVTNVGYSWSGYGTQPRLRVEGAVLGNKGVRCHAHRVWTLPMLLLHTHTHTHTHTHV
jgi:hypothetical protein